MENLNLVELQNKTAAVVADYEKNQLAVAEEKQAAIALLERVIDIARPAIRAIGSRVIWLDLKKRYVNLENGSIAAGDLVIDENGDMLRVDWKNKDPEDKHLVTSPGTLDDYDIDFVIECSEKLCDLISRAGSRADSTKKAQERAAKLRALAALL